MDKNQYTFELEASPFSWMLYAQELHESANIIIANSGFQINQFPKLDTGSPLQNAFFLNFGFSVENLLKATLIAENSQQIVDFKISKNISTGHKLDKLADKLTSIELDEKEIELLDILTSAIPSWGRYPIPKSANEMPVKTSYSMEVHKALENLWNRLIVNLYNLIKDGDWVSPSGIRTGWFRDSTLEKDFDKNFSQKDNELMKMNASNVDISKTIYVD